MPAVPAGARVWRIMAADAAARAELTYDRYDDLELAVTEVFGVLMASEPEAVELRLETLDGRIAAEAHPIGSTRTTEPDELSLIVLGAVTDAMSSDAATGAIKLEVAGR